MGQAELMSIVNKNKDRWFTLKEIADELGISEGSVRKSYNKVGWHHFNTKRVDKKLYIKAKDEK